VPIITYEFNALWRLEPEALGVPGKRAFRLVGENDAARAILWAEKQHLQGLAMAAQQMLGATDGMGEDAAEIGRGTPAAMRTTLIMRVDRFELGVDPATGGYVLLAHDMEAPDAAPHTFACRPSRRQLETLATSIETLAAAGRPRCPVCGEPLEAGVQHRHNSQLEAGN
jgi:hypothetical protein